LETCLRVNLDTTQDFPFKTFVRNRDDYLDKMLRLEGRGDPDNYSACHGCSALDPIYRCAHQTCYGAGLFCSMCIVKQHTLLPTHWIEVSLARPFGSGRLMCL
jgi:hypothetical protein